MTKIANDLIEAYRGRYEDAHKPQEAGRFVGEPTTEEAIQMIRKDTPKERLATYLQWNGIIGYTNRIWEISQGETEV